VLERPVGVEGLSVDVGVSIGLSLAPEHGRTASVLMRRADIAMYDAKALHGVAVYDPARDDSSTSRLALVAQLREALASDGFVLHYQPQLLAVDGTVLRFEALIRWPSPRGLVPPDEFLPVAERAGLLQGLTTWVLSRALDDVVAWRAAGHECGVAVNLSPRNLLESGLAAGVRRLLRERGLPPECLTLEITEGSIMAEPDRALETLSQLRSIGVRLSVDDFGTGYSSLSYLRRLPVDEVKIDKSFVRDLAEDEQDAAIVHAVVTLAGSLSLTVVAEGVEHQAAWDRLVELDCDVVQGYHVGRPMPAAQVLGWIDEHSGREHERRGVTPLFGGIPRPRNLA
jgi:EAL domain-containing protein (putative c-di-GMP-specific phosphodiesterase class I)